MTASHDDPPPAHAKGSPPGAASPSDAEGATDPRLQAQELNPARPRPPRPSAATAFSPEDLVAGRFRIVRLIASGGMGEVYEAFDLELKERVALKTVRPEIAEDETVMARFRQEIQLARRVTHPSVCRTFDLFRHRLAPPGGWQGPPPEVTLLTMELLEGETLADRMKGKGPMTTGEAFQVVDQVASALAAAHEAGIVHRDLKSSNVILVPSRKADKRSRAVVTDFGLAHGGASSAGLATSGAGAMAGTPAYMAPEQVGGGKTTPATDVYALGVLMYEMVTGRWPFEGDTPVAVALKRLTEKPPSPRTHRPELDPRWEAAILKCLERDPADRFESPLDVLHVLAGEKVTRRPSADRRAKRRAAWTLAAVVLLAGSGLWHVRRTRHSPAPPRAASTQAPVAARRSVAVLGFKNLSQREDTAWLTKALSEMLAMELAAGERLRVIPGENVARMKADLSLPEAETLAPDTLAKIRTNLGTDLVVLGSYFASGKQAGERLRLDLRVQDTSGETVASLSETGAAAEFLDLVSRSGSQLRQALGAAATSPSDRAAGQAPLPSNLEAARLYAEGLGKLRSFDALAAQTLLEEAVAADPGYPLTHSALAEAWSVLGYDARARKEAKMAFDLSSSLRREERLWVEGRHREAAREWDKAIETYRTLVGFFPDNLEYGLRLAEAETAAGKGTEALEAVQALRKLPPPASDDPRIDLAEARAAQQLALFERERAAAAKAAEKGALRGARLLVAEARVLEGWAWGNLGDPGKATAAGEQAKRLYSEAGHRRGVAQALDGVASVLWQTGDLQGALDTAQQALAIFREIGDRRGAARALNTLGIALSHRGDLAGTKKMYEEALAVSREIGDQPGLGRALNNLADPIYQLGELDAAKRACEEAIPILRDGGGKNILADALSTLGKVLFEQGHLAPARERQEESLAISRSIGRKRLTAQALLRLAEIRSVEGDLAGARRGHEEALAIRDEIDAKGEAADSRLALAALSIEEGRPAEAEGPAGTALAQFQKQQARHKEAQTLAVLAVSLLAQGRLGEARRAVDGATKLVERVEYRSIRLQVALAAARLHVASDQPARAVKLLEAVLSEATRRGFVGFQFEARLALGELEMRSAARGRARLLDLGRDASAKGFLLVARKARKAAE